MMALADAALELEYVIQVLAHLGHEFEYDVEFETKTHDAEKRIAEAEAYVIRHGSVEVGRIRSVPTIPALTTSATARRRGNTRGTSSARSIRCAS